MNDPVLSSGSRKERLIRTRDMLGANWGWFVVLGLAQIVLGVAALVHVFAATIVSVVFIGILMLIGGAGQLIQAWRIKHMAGFLVWTLSGILYLAAGLIAIINPIVGASFLTLMFGAVLIGTGALRLWIWFNNRAQQGWKWLAFSGIVTLATGLLIAANWPGNSVWILGLLLGFDLLFHGWTILFVGMALRRRHRSR